MGKKRKTEVVQPGTQGIPELNTDPGQKKKKKWQNIWRLGTVLSLAGAFILFTRYMDISTVYRTEPSVTDLYGGVDACNRYNYVLYRDLYNAVNGKHLTFDQLYGVYDEEAWNLELSEGLISQGKYIIEEGSGSGGGPTEVREETEASQEDIQWLWEGVMRESLTNVYAYLGECLEYLSQNMQEKMGAFDYWMQDHTTGAIVTNTLQTERGKDFSTEEYSVWSQMDYDDGGNLQVKAASDSDVNTLTRTLYDGFRKGLFGSYVTNLQTYVPGEFKIKSDQYAYVEDASSDSSFLNQLEERVRGYGGPRNCTVIYGIKRSQWETLVGNYRVQNDFMDVYREYEYTGLRGIFLLLAAVLWGWGFFYGNPRREEKRLLRHFRRAPAEAVIGGTIALPMVAAPLVLQWASGLYITNYPRYYLRTVYWWTWGDILAYGLNLAAVTGLLFAAWYAGCCLGEIRRLGIRGYLHKRMVCSRVWGWCKERIRRYYQTLVNLDITRDSRRQVIRLLAVNGIVVLLLCTMWVAGWFGVIIYTLLLYFVIKKYISDLQKKYSILLRATNEIANGNLEVKITEHLGVFEPFKPQIYRIEEGFQKAVAEEVKSQRMKTELITNVSHDLKTPLTAIITYVNLLKEANVTEEQRVQYLQILEQKSLRLKALIEDLFEVSKANSKNITLNLVDVDIVNLLRQVEFEQEDRLEERNLAVRLRLPEEKVVVRLDSQKAYRIYENLFGNIIKYAMEGTRIYVDLEQTEQEVTVRLKNITEQEITVSAEELTERFVRGDSSRNTEGSGLGLAIVRSFTELMGGRFEVTVDGDLFTASTTWVREQSQPLS